MSFTYQCGTVEDPYLSEELARGWDTRDEAESWLSSVYADLLDEGVQEVTLIEDGLPVYSMGLDA